MQFIWAVIKRTISSFFYLALALALFTIMFAMIGLQLFSDKVGIL